MSRFWRMLRGEVRLFQIEAADCIVGLTVSLVQRLQIKPQRQSEERRLPIGGDVVNLGPIIEIPGSLFLQGLVYVDKQLGSTNLQPFRHHWDDLIFAS